MAKVKPDFVYSKNRKVQMQKKLIGERIKHIRGNKSQESFSKELNAKQRTLANYESGENFPSAEFLLALAEYYMVNIEWVLSGKGEALKKSIQQEGVDLEINDNSTCERCTELRKELAEERQERREVTKENRQLWKENAELREYKARLEGNIKGGSKIVDVLKSVQPAPLYTQTSE